jgi:hypothetical protein
MSVLNASCPAGSRPTSHCERPVGESISVAEVMVIVVFLSWWPRRMAAV